MKSIKELYRKEFELYDEVFEIKYRENGIPYTNAIPRGSMVTETLKQIADIWSDFELASLLLKNECEEYLSCLLLIGVHPHRALPAISRTALFSERIFVPHPMLLYLESRGEQGPYARPEEWAPQFMRAALYISSLRGWIADDFLRLIPMPELWSNNIKQRVHQTLSLSEQQKNEIFDKYKSGIDNLDFMAELLADTDEDIRKFMLDKLRREDSAGYNKVVELLQQQPKYPDWLEFPWNDKVRGEILHFGSILHPIEIKYLMQNWNIYVTPTSIIEKHRLLNQGNDKNVITNFLLNVPVEFSQDIPTDLMYYLRKEELLKNFRLYLLEQLDKVKKVTDENDIVKIQETFNNTIDLQLGEMSEELHQAKKGILNDIVDVALNNTGSSYSFVNGSLDIGAVLNILGGLASKTVPRVQKLKKVKKNPLIVLHNLKK